MEDSEKQIYVGDFDGNEEDKKTTLEKKVLGCEELSTEDKLQIIRAIEHSQNLLFEKKAENPIPCITYEPYKPMWFNNYNSDSAEPIFCKTAFTTANNAKSDTSEVEEILNAI